MFLTQDSSYIYIVCINANLIKNRFCLGPVTVQRHANSGSSSPEPEPLNKLFIFNPTHVGVGGIIR